jgi:hypothetical protein
MMDAAYLKAAHPPPFRILGRDLEPFCMGHELLFQRFENRFSIESTEQPGIDDLLKAVHLCSRPYSRNSSLDDFSISLRARVWSKVFGPKYIAQAIIRFHQYIEAHTEIPEYYAKDDPDARVCGAPTIQAVKVARMANSTLTEDEILNLPFSLAFWDHLTWLEGQGQIQIIDDAERERQKQLDEDYKRLEKRINEVAERLRAEAAGEVSFGS